MDRLWEQVRPLYLSLHAYMRMKLREKYGDIVPENGSIPAHLLGNIWAQSWENLYDDVAPKTGAPAYDLTKILTARKTTADRHGEVRRALLRVARRGAAAADLLRTVAPGEAARSRRRLPRQRVGHRSRRRRPHQDVHRSDRRRLHDDPSRAGPQLLSARLQGSARAVPRQRERRLPRSARRHHRAVGDARLSRQGRTDSPRRPTPRATSGCCCSRRWRRSRSCRSACWSINGAGRCSRAR